MMKRVLMLGLILVFGISGALFGAANQKKVLYYVLPIVNNVKDTKFYPLLEQDAKVKVLYYLEPMEGKIKSYTPKKDDMGMDYIPYYIDETTKKLAFYVNPMDIKITSDKPKKDEMGMDYIPIYEAKVYKK